MKKINLSIFASALVVTGALVLTGCGGSDSTTTGGGSSSSEVATSSEAASSTPAGDTVCLPGSSCETTETNTTEPSTTDVTVVDGYVIGATVADCNGVTADTNAQGIATAAYDLACTLISQGGKIDANQNGVADADELPAPDMRTPAGKSVVSPLTELVVAGADESKLAAVLGVSVADIYSDPIASNNVAVAKALQIAYAVEVGNKTADFVNNINSSDVTTSTPTTDTTTTDTTTTDTTTSSTPASDLPAIGRYSLRSSDLPSIGQYDTSLPTESTTASSSSVATVESELPAVGQYETAPTTTESPVATGSIEEFANKALALFDDNSPEAGLIQAVLSLTVTDVAEIENEIRVQKEEVANAAGMLADETATDATGCLPGSDCTTADTTIEECLPSSDCTKTETTPDTTNEEVADENATTGTTDEATTDNTTTDTATSSSAGSDLPQFSY